MVIIIIVLLILVGISIATLTGENGILNKAQTAKEKTDKEMAKEKVQLAVMGSYGTDGQLNYEELKENLDKVEGIKNVPNNITQESFPIKVYVDQYKVTIEDDGKVAVDVLTPPQQITLEQAKEEGTVLNENNLVIVKDKYGNKIIVLEGFKIAEDSADDVTGGVVIEDVNHGETIGSQFVWIPVGEVKSAEANSKTIELNRYTFAEDGTPTAQGEELIDSYHQELATSDKGNIVAKDIGEFKTSVAENGGYYIARYGAGDSFATINRNASSSKTVIPVSRQGQYAYNYVTQPQAANLSRNMYLNKSFTSDLVNSYAWDTAVVFIQEFSGDLDYSRQKSLQKSLAKTGEATDGKNKDVRCNIYDMAGNTYEWTTESSSYVNNGGVEYPCVSRADNFKNNVYYTIARNGAPITMADDRYSFRSILYF